PTRCVIGRARGGRTAMTWNDFSSPSAMHSDERNNHGTFFMRPTFSFRYRLLPLTLLSALLILLCSCKIGGGGSDDKGDARFRVLNASTGYTSLDVYSNDQD